MNTSETIGKAILYVTAAAVCLVSARSSLLAQARNTDEELEVGQEVFNQLKANAQIIESSPLYERLGPVTEAITRAAQPKYNHPFKFYLVHEAQPNAFSVPGGNVYVVDSLLYFVRNADELGGTLCHEVSHTIHHDSMELIKKEQKIAEREIGAAVLLGADRFQLLTILLLGRLRSLSYSREDESRADLSGADICAAAGYNPWGLTWLFQDFQNAGKGDVPQLLSDHPTNQSRVTALEEHFRKNPSVFGKFNPDPKAAKPFSIPPKAPEVFLR